MRWWSRSADRAHEHGGSHRIAAVLAEEHHDPQLSLQRRYVHVKVHAIDALDLQRNPLLENLRNAARERHVWLRSLGQVLVTTAVFNGDN
jgi:hypothetical protein